MIKALIFDFDGTIIDTETAWYIAFRDAYKEHGVDLTLDMYPGALEPVSKPSIRTNTSSQI